MLEPGVAVDMTCSGPGFDSPRNHTRLGPSTCFLVLPNGVDGPDGPAAIRR
jgi:hypothetical protein